MAEYATLHYAAPQVARPAVYLYKPPPEAKGRDPGRVGHRCRIEPIADGEPASLDVQGFAPLAHKTKVRNFYDPEEVRAVAFPEAEALVRQATGAREVKAFDHNVRCAEKAERGEDGAQMPVKSAHNDYTEASGPQRLRDLLPERADALLRRRFSIINLWRPIIGPVRRSPLAVLDARSIAPGDFIPTDLVYRDRIGEVYTMRHNPAHRWRYRPHMRADEALLLKCYDSDPTIAARFTAHSAFEPDGLNPQAPHRQSVEIRMLVFQ